MNILEKLDAKIDHEYGCTTIEVNWELAQALVYIAKAAREMERQYLLSRDMVKALARLEVLE